MSRGPILIVDHDPLTEERLCPKLTAAGWASHVERSGDAGLKALAAIRPVALVVNLSLEGPSGFRLAEAACHPPKGRAPIPVVALSVAFLEARNRADAQKRLPLLEILPKPVDPDRVLELLAQALDGSVGGEPEGSRARRSEDDTQPHLQRSPAESELSEHTRRTRQGSGLFRASLEEGAPPLDCGKEQSGDLARMLFGRLLHDLHVGQATGVLSLRCGRKRKEMYIEQGNPVHVVGNLATECLGRLLVQDGQLTEQLCEESVSRLEKSGELQGQILIELGAIDERRLADSLKSQLERKLLEIFSWDGGTYHFRPGQSTAPQRSSLSEGVPRLIADGIRDWSSTGRIVAELAGLEGGFASWGSDGRYREQELGLSAEEEEFFAHLDGQQTVGESLQGSELGSDKAGRLMLLLLCTRKVELRGEQDGRHTKRLHGPGSP